METPVLLGGHLYMETAPKFLSSLRVHTIEQTAWEKHQGVIQEGNYRI